MRYEGIGFLFGETQVPYVPTPMKVVKAALKEAGLSEDDVLYDLGCGDGRIPIIAAKEFGVRKAYCIEIQKNLALIALERVRKEGLEDKVIVINADFFDVNISDATIITLYLTEPLLAMVRNKIESEVKRRVRVVSILFPLPGVKPYKVIEVENEGLHVPIYYYLVPS